MTQFRERLWPAPWLFVATALVIPASFLVFLPINEIAGLVVAFVLYAGCVVLLLAAAPRVEITETEFIAGKARIPLALVGDATAARGDDAWQERGPRLDARAWLLIRGWIDPVVRVAIDDDADPTPYWLVSTRRPEELVEAIESARRRTPGK
ncbi:MAG: DUF3093 domain-containing protein [Rhodoglobus sp.]|nr:DUF3093 domain-containing protein [Rhodoglobus sp.]